jgi:hypothetical protein
MDKASTITIVCSVFTAIVSVIVALWVRDRRKKCIGWEVLGSLKLVTKSSEANGIDILYKDLKVEDPHLLTLRICNAGNVPILVHEFDKPLIVALGSNVLGFSILSKTEHFDPLFTELEANNLKMEPVMLNSGDEVRLQIITRDKPVVDCKGRIVGGTIRPLATGKTNFSDKIIVTFVMLSIVSIVSLSGNLRILARNVAAGIGEDFRSLMNTPFHPWLLLGLLGEMAGLLAVWFLARKRVSRWLNKLDNKSLWSDKWR